MDEIDIEIIDLYWSRSESAIAATSEKYGGYCWSIAMNILGSSQDAEEVLSDTYMNAWNSIPPKRPECLRLYLGKIARNLSISRFRMLNSEKRGLGQAEIAISELGDCVPDKTDVEGVIDRKALAELLGGFLRGQETDKRNIFVKRYWHMMPIRDIALSYGMSESKVTSMLYRMRNELRIHLEKEGILP